MRYEVVALHVVRLLEELFNSLATVDEYTTLSDLASQFGEVGKYITHIPVVQRSVKGNDARHIIETEDALVESVRNYTLS